MAKKNRASLKFQETTATRAADVRELSEIVVPNSDSGLPYRVDLITKVVGGEDDGKLEFQLSQKAGKGRRYESRRYGPDDMVPVIARAPEPPTGTFSTAAVRAGDVKKGDEVVVPDLDQDNSYRVENVVTARGPDGEEAIEFRLGRKEGKDRVRETIRFATEEIIQVVRAASEGDAAPAPEPQPEPAPEPAPVPEPKQEVQPAPAPETAPEKSAETGPASGAPTYKSVPVQELQRGDVFCLVPGDQLHKVYFVYRVHGDDGGVCLLTTTNMQQTNPAAIFVRQSDEVSLIVRSGTGAKFNILGHSADAVARWMRASGYSGQQVLSAFDHFGVLMFPWEAERLGKSGGKLQALTDAEKASLDAVLANGEA